MFLLKIFWATCVHTRRHTPGRLCSIAAQQSYFRCFRVLSTNILLMKSLHTYKHTYSPLAHQLAHKQTVSILHSFGLFLSLHKQNIFFFHLPFLFNHFEPLFRSISFSIQHHLKLSVKLSIKTFLRSISQWNRNYESNTHFDTSMNID